MVYCRWTSRLETRLLKLINRKYLADGSVDVRLATENVLSEFLREIKCIAEVQEKQADIDRQKKEARAVQKRSSRQTMESIPTIEMNDEAIAEESDEETHDDADEDHEHGHEKEAENDNEWEGQGSGQWVPGQGVFVDHAAIMDIMIQHLSYPGM